MYIILDFGATSIKSCIFRNDKISNYYEVDFPEKYIQIEPKLEGKNPVKDIKTVILIKESEEGIFFGFKSFVCIL